MAFGLISYHQVEISRSLFNCWRNTSWVNAISAASHKLLASYSTSIYKIRINLKKVRTTFSKFTQIQSVLLSSLTFPIHTVGRVVQSLIKLTQDKRDFWFQFCIFSVRFSAVYIVYPSVLSLSNLKLHKRRSEKHSYKKNYFDYLLILG